MWFTLSLLTIAAWALSDLFSKRGTKPEDKNSHLKLIIAVGTFMTAHALFYLLANDVPFSSKAIISYAPVSAMYILAMALGYVGLRYIELSISTPICNSSGAVACILCILILKQSISPMQIVGVVIVSVSIFLLSMSEREAERESLRAASEKSSRFDNKFLALLFPLLYCFIDGLGSFLDAFYLDTGILEENVANLAYEFTFGICALFSYLYLRFVKKERFSFIGQKDFCIAAACETAGQFTYIHALGDNAVVAAPLISSYCVFSVMLSRLILKEKLRAKQYIIIAALVSGIVILGYFDV